MILEAKLVYNNNSYTIEVNLDETLEVLKYVIYSVTNVPPEHQKIILLGEVLRDDADLSKLGISPGQLIMLLNTAEMRQAQPKIEEMISPTAWHTCCSGVFFQSESVVQPSFLATATRKVICYSCAITCMLPNEILPQPSLEPFQCQCALQSRSNAERQCLFAERLHRDPKVEGKAKEIMLDTLNAAAKNQVESMHRLQSSRPSSSNNRSTDIFSSRLRGIVSQVLLYENPEFQQKAREVIPISLLQARAKSNEKKLPSIQDEMFKQLLFWFKHDFFKWVDKPQCDFCMGTTQLLGNDHPKAEEAKYQANTVEVYRCLLCSTQKRFPRYNDAVKLLETRAGRCGEWANCFALVCRSLAFDIRYVVDFTDHVWIEYYSDSCKRWIHADPCENAMDCQLMYEQGWGKKITYIIAVGRDNCADVTKRYTRNYLEVLKRRTLVTEDWLHSFLQNVNNELLYSSTVSSERRALLIERAKEENIQLQSGNDDKALKEEESTGLVANTSYLPKDENLEHRNGRSRGMNQEKSRPTVDSEHSIV